jgi:3-oxoacyl-[acyl-carrier protein] reductase
VVERFGLLGAGVLVTGGSVGIGRAVALAVAQAGADVVFTYHSHTSDETAAAIRALGRRAVALPLDVTQPKDVDERVKQAAHELGGSLDILINNAGGLVGRVAIADMTVEHWRRVLELNLSSVFYCTRAALPFMTEGRGRIVNISSVAALDGGGPGAAAYAAAKAGLLALTRALAKELAPRGITVNAVAPGLILDTPFHATFSTEERVQATIGRIPVGRGGVPDDVANAVVYLSSAGAGFVTGEVIRIDGGLLFA